MRSLPLALSLCALLAPAALHADSFTGSFEVDGTLTADTGTTLEFSGANVSSDPSKLTGSFMTLLTPGDTVAASEPALVYSPYVPGSEVFSVDGLTLTLNSFDKTATGDFSGLVTLSATGYDPALANLSLVEGPSGTTFEATTITSTPEPSTLVLLGSGVLGAAGMVRRRFARG